MYKYEYMYMHTHIHTDELALPRKRHSTLSYDDVQDMADMLESSVDVGI